MDEEALIEVTTAGLATDSASGVFVSITRTRGQTPSCEPAFVIGLGKDGVAQTQPVTVEHIAEIIELLTQAIQP